MRSRLPLVLSGLLFTFGPASHAPAQPARAEAIPKIEPLRFKEAIEKFEAEDKMARPPEGAIVVTGASSIVRWHPTIKEDLAPLTVIPRGFGGSTMEDALYLARPRGPRLQAARHRAVRG